MVARGWGRESGAWALDGSADFMGSGLLMGVASSEKGVGVAA